LVHYSGEDVVEQSSSHYSGQETEREQECLH
jgi:hypothetical protein